MNEKAGKRKLPAFSFFDRFDFGRGARRKTSPIGEGADAPRWRGAEPAGMPP
jgi:hypothetical protein